MDSDAKPDAADIDLGALTHRVHDEVTRQIRAAFDALVATSAAERDRAAESARKAAQAAASSEIAAAVAAAEEKTRSIEMKTSAAVDAAYKAGALKGYEDGREQTLAEVRDEIQRAVREAIAGAEQTTQMAIEAAESAARARTTSLEQAMRQQIETVERDAHRDLDAQKEAHRARIAELETAQRNQLEAVEESARQRVKDAEAEAGHRLEIAVAAATTAARADLRSNDGASGERLVDAIRAIDRARSLTEILDTLASCAGREAKAAAVLIVRSGRLRGWRAIGLGPLDADAKSIDAPFESAGILATAVDGNTLVSGGPAPAFAADSKNPVAIPLAISGLVVAVLYADRASSLQSLETIARHAARALESLTAFKTARALVSGEAHGPGAGNGDEDVAAKRYARLLISEIRLYHEADVTAGRRERDLTSRLGGEIARARVLYEQRVPAHVRRRADHFRDELVRTLADGDAALVQ